MSRKSIFGVAAISALLFSAFLVQAQSTTSTTLISAPEAKKMLEAGEFDLVLDVRTPEEYTGPFGHIKDARLIPIQVLESQLKDIEAYKDKKVLVYCHSGGRSAKSARILKDNGFKDVSDLQGGITGWKAQGYATDNKASRN
ncbi:MAG: rhodanese-like domain-containing protein [Nitrospinota bacterium]|nr:rhodanese-like domain-containing protein [Nitrospinota bacterium]MDH5677634.1 rhodanese-like domain-containing protein [Nitrospinota bacterium]MDH5755813.1 rhodanese-like domain-containing protein [Nitrospinota bacterium]